jgi:hypothetical protein
MKSKDLTSYILVVGIAALVSFFGSNMLFGSQKDLSAKVEEVDPITSDFNYEKKPYYEGNPLNPTKDITISENQNNKPLGQ